MNMDLAPRPRATSATVSAEVTGQVVDGQLSKDEEDRLATLEERIAPVVQGFIEAGEALAEIRADRLYRATHATFEDYCRERWDFSKVRATQLITASVVTTVTTKAGDPAPASERVARERAPLRTEPTNLREAWHEAVEQHGDKPTAAAVREVVQAKVNKPEPAAHPHTTCPVCGGRGSVRTDKPLGWAKVAAKPTTPTARKPGQPRPVATREELSGRPEQIARKNHKRLATALGDMAATAQGLDGFPMENVLLVTDPDELERWYRQLDQIATAARRFGEVLAEDERERDRLSADPRSGGLSSLTP
jgi:hypothetical protein